MAWFSRLFQVCGIFQRPRSNSPPPSDPARVSRRPSSIDFYSNTSFAFSSFLDGCRSFLGSDGKPQFTYAPEVSRKAQPSGTPLPRISLSLSTFPPRAQPHERRSIAFYLGLSPLSIAVNEGGLEKFSTCFELVTLASNADLEASKYHAGRSGEFFVVGDGQVDISVKIPTPNKKTGYIREVLCSKKQGDILYVPAVESLAGSIQHSSAASAAAAEMGVGGDGLPPHIIGDTSRLRRTSARLKTLLSRGPVRGSLSGQQRVGLDHMQQFTLATTTEDAVSQPQVKPPPSMLRKEDSSTSMDSMNRIEKIMKHLDMTTVTAPYGATLLRLDKARFDAFESSARAAHKKEYSEDGALIAKELPWSRHSIEHGKKSNGRGGGGVGLVYPEAVPPAVVPASTLSLPDFELMRVMMASNIQDYLKRIPFLTKVPMSRIQMLGEMSQFEVLAADHVVCQEGSNGDRVYVVIFGQLAVYAKKDDPSAPLTGKDVSSSRSPKYGSSTRSLHGTLLGTLGHGDHFGEMAVLADIPRQATVKTVSSCLLISISRSHFRNLIKVVPDIGETVQTVMRLYMLSKFFHSLLHSEEFSKLDQKTIESRLLNTCELLEAPADSRLIQEGQDADAFFFLYHGRVVAHQSAAAVAPGTKEAAAQGGSAGSGDDQRIHLGILGPGSYFGEISILTEEKCRASVVTVSRCMLLKVSKAQFQSVWCSIPGFRAEFLVRIFGKTCRLEHVRSHVVTNRAFSAFLKSEHASENSDYLDAVDEFRSKHTERAAHENLDIAEGMVARFLDEKAQAQVNIPQAMLRRCQASLDVMAAKIDPMKRNPPRELFDESKAEICKILELGPFARFKRTPGFTDIMAKMRIYEHLDLSQSVLSDFPMGPSASRRFSIAPPPTSDQARAYIMTSSSAPSTAE